MVGVLAIVLHRSADTTRTRSHSHNKRSKQWRRDSCSAEPALGALGCADELGTMIDAALSGLEVAARCGVAAGVQTPPLIDATFYTRVIYARVINIQQERWRVDRATRRSARATRPTGGSAAHTAWCAWSSPFPF